ncbi:lysine N(6)-hydroxylase/L-ornithine N(5)-oxygenase family protein [Nocardiopsis xinjiangensis]|uniref:lysine N(6)-hydroxylase/L-ornithine N(5)-oxygenase family protein n=1 Tax=Nocardiopsis xinjiangensis TaxID=124285 RepID=UPI00034DCB66|nr:SidA/IucD/PvdA family monooxygenase [Nocardiopsis xinjiangensis]
MQIHDVLGIGLGPGNLSLAIALAEQPPETTMKFLEAKESNSWQSGMLLDGSDIQNNPIRDLVSLRNPRSRFSFVNYPFEVDGLVEFLNLPGRYPLRKEYAKYISWVAQHFDHVVDYGTYCTRVSTTAVDGALVYEVETSDGGRHRARALVLGTGRTPHVPAPFSEAVDRRVFHLNDYLPRVAELSETGPPASVAVIGGSQSAAELTLDLTKRFPGARVRNLVRSYSLRLKDTSPFSDEGYFPAFTRYYNEASPTARRQLDTYMRATNYSSVDEDVLDELYMLIHEQRLDGEQRTFVDGNRVVDTLKEGEDRISLGIREVVTGETETDEFDMVVVATGFRDLGPGSQQEPFPPLLAEITDRLEFDSHELLQVGPDYAVERRDTDLPPLFLNGLCEYTHGIGDAGSFSLLSLRSQTILTALTKALRSDMTATT